VTQIRVPMDRLIAETGEKGSARAHLISVFGNDQEIAAIAAALTETSWFNVSGPGLADMAVSLGEQATVFRASVSLPGRKRALRHLVALSEELGVRYVQWATKRRNVRFCATTDRSLSFTGSALNLDFPLSQSGVNGLRASSEGLGQWHNWLDSAARPSL
jgi:hypothetical protein